MFITALAPPAMYNKPFQVNVFHCIHFFSADIAFMHLVHHHHFCYGQELMAYFSMLSSHINLIMYIPNSQYVYTFLFFIVFIETKPQINADERRFIAWDMRFILCCGRSLEYHSKYRADGSSITGADIVMVCIRFFFNPGAVQ